MKEKILAILKSIRNDIDFEHATSLGEDGVLDSFDIVMLVNELDGAFGTHINVVDIVPENFDSIDTIIALMEKAMK